MRWIALLGIVGVLAVPAPSRLDAILAKGEIVVGTTGDYRPFSHLKPDGSFEGLDIDAAHALAEALGVQVRFVRTSWPELVNGIREGRYDVAMSGVTRTLERQKFTAMTEPYLTLGKCALIRRADRDRFPDLEAIDEPGVRIGVNPGGTNETFVRERIREAEIIEIEDNLAIPGAVAAGRVDVMITDNVEAILASSEDARLYAVSPDTPLTHDELSYMIARDDYAFLAWLNHWLHRMKLDGEIDRLREKWIGPIPAFSRSARIDKGSTGPPRLRRESRAMPVSP